MAIMRKINWIHVVGFAVIAAQLWVLVYAHRQRRESAIQIYSASVLKRYVEAANEGCNVIFHEIEEGALNYPHPKADSILREANLTIARLKETLLFTDLKSQIDSVTQIFDELNNKSTYVTGRTILCGWGQIAFHPLVFGGSYGDVFSAELYFTDYLGQEESGRLTYYLNGVQLPQKGGEGQFSIRMDSAGMIPLRCRAELYDRVFLQTKVWEKTFWVRVQ